MLMYLIKILFLLSLTIFSISLYSQSDQEKRDTVFNDSKYHEIMSKLDNISDPVNYVNTLWYIWTNRDCAIGSEISIYIAQSILKYPNLIFYKFKNNPVNFNDWVERLPYELFTDYNGSRIPELQKLKQDLIHELLICKNRSDLKKYRQIVDVLYNKILVVQIRKID